MDHVHETQTQESLLESNGTVNSVDEIFEFSLSFFSLIAICTFFVGKMLQVEKPNDCIPNFIVDREGLEPSIIRVRT